MVSSVLVDSLANPDAVLLDLYDPDAPLDDFPALVARTFAATFATQDAFQEIPALGLAHPPELFPDRALVRFRAMVQDTSASPEMYLAKRRGGRCGGWGLVDEPHGDADRRESINYADLRECTVVWAVNVPGENEWCAAEADASDFVRPPRTHNPLQPHKFPIPEAPHVGVQVKVYEPVVLKSTQLIAFVGILTSEPVHTELDFENPTDVPTLHVLFSQSVPPTVVPRPYPAPGDIATVRDELVAWIADEALAGDRDAAEWVLLSVLARVQSRTPPILPPSLTLVHFPPPPINVSSETSLLPTLVHILAAVLSVSAVVPLSLPTINTHQFSPESKKEDLYSGWLQFPDGATVVLTESGINEGVVTEQGLLNLRAIQEVITSQTLEYVFPYSRFSFPTDISFVVLAEGRKSAFFQTSITVPLRKAEPASAEVNLQYYKPFAQVRMPDADTLERFRALIGGAKARATRMGVGEAASEHIQTDFVRERKAAGVTPDDLIHRMTVARLLALSLHVEEVDIAVWDRAKALDARRRDRVGAQGD